MNTDVYKIFIPVYRLYMFMTSHTTVVTVYTLITVSWTDWARSLLEYHINTQGMGIMMLFQQLTIFGFETLRICFCALLHYLKLNICFLATVSL